MQCLNCQSELPPGGTFCTNCGTPVTPASGVAPTMLASSPNQGFSAPDPTPIPSAYPPYPPTNYGEAAPPPPPGSYAPPPQSYSAPAQPYGVPQTPYGAPQAGQYGAPPVYAQPQPKSNRGCVTALVIVLVLVVLVVGGVIAGTYYVFNRASNAVSTVSSGIQTAVPTINASQTETPGTTNTGNAPNASQIDANAARMIFKVQTSSGVNDVSPVDSKASFHTGDKIYVTFRTTGAKGYILAKWYLDGQHAFDNDVLPNQGGEQAGYVAGYFNLGGTAVIGLYWCTQSDCSDAALAQVATVSVS